MQEMIVDIFAGGGGASLGISQAMGVDVDLAVNHDEDAMAMHWMNHQHTRHDCADIYNVDPARATVGRPVGLMWASPDCTHFSKAKGGKPRKKNIRSLAWVVVKWAAAVRPRVIILENVEEFRDWGPLDKECQPIKSRKGQTYRLWLGQLQKTGYQVESRILRACDYGAPTIRKRLFVIARCDGQPIVWPEPTHGPGRIPYRTAAECIDWTLPCPSIFLSPKEAKEWGVPRPLKPKTMERIARGIRKFVLESGNPFIIKFRQDATGQTIAEPMHTVTAGSWLKRPAGAGHAMGLVVPLLENLTHGGRTEPIEQPMRTITTANRGEKAVVVAEFVTKFFGTTTGSDLREPIPTITGQGQHIGEVRAFLMKYYKSSVGQDLQEPLHTAMNKARFGLVTVEGQDYQIADIGLRMLTPRELARAQGFPDEYILTGSKSSQVAKIGNSVCPPIAAALVKANVQLQEVKQAAVV